MSTGKILKGENAPLASDLESWLEKNPGYEEVPRDEDSEEDSDDETKGEGANDDPETVKAKLETALKGKGLITKFSLMCFWINPYELRRPNEPEQPDPTQG